MGSRCVSERKLYSISPSDLYPIQRYIAERSTVMNVPVIEKESGFFSIAFQMCQEDYKKMFSWAEEQGLLISE